MPPPKPVPGKPAAPAPAKPRKKAKAAAAVKRGPAAGVAAASPATKEPLAAARGMPGWRAARTLVGEALAANASGILVEAGGKTVTVRRRVGDVWQPPMPVPGDDAVEAFAALKRLAAPVKDDPGFVVSARKLPRRSCRLAGRVADRREQVLVLLGPPLPRPPRPHIGRLVAAALGRLVPGFLKRQPPPPERDPSLPPVSLEAAGPDAAARQEAVVESDGYGTACDLVAAAVRERANTIIFEAGPQGVAVQLDVDGVTCRVPTLEPPLALDKADVAAVVGALKAVAGLDPKARGPQSGRVNAVVGGKPWACTIAGSRGPTGERLEVVIDHVRPKFKTLADLGVTDDVAGRLQECLTVEGGLIVVAAPRRGGLSTLFDGLLTAADRLLRDFVVLEDAAAPRPEIQNVKPFRWDSRTGGSPVAALDAALREYPNVIAARDLEDADTAKRLVAQAADGRLVIVGIRAADATEALARLAAFGADPRVLARVLLGAVGTRLVRKLCPKCRTEYFPTADALARLKLDPDADVTLFRPAPAGCSVCTGTGYLGRTAVCEFASGPTLRDAVAAAGAAAALRQAAVKDGMTTVQQAAIAKAAAAVTSVDEVQRVFRKA